MDEKWIGTTDQIGEAFFEWSKPYRKEIRRYLDLIAKIEDRVKYIQSVLHNTD